MFLRCIARGRHAADNSDIRCPLFRRQKIYRLPCAAVQLRGARLLPPMTRACVGSQPVPRLRGRRGSLQAGCGAPARRIDGSFCWKSSFYSRLQVTPASIETVSKYQVAAYQGTASLDTFLENSSLA